MKKVASVALFLLCSAVAVGFMACQCGCFCGNRCGKWQALKYVFILFYCIKRYFYVVGARSGFVSLYVSGLSFCFLYSFRLCLCPVRLFVLFDFFPLFFVSRTPATPKFARRNFYYLPILQVRDGIKNALTNGDGRIFFLYWRVRSSRQSACL